MVEGVPVQYRRTRPVGVLPAGSRIGKETIDQRAQVVAIAVADDPAIELVREAVDLVADDEAPDAAAS